MPFQIRHTSWSVSDSYHRTSKCNVCGCGIHSELLLLLLLLFQWFVSEFSYESCFRDASWEVFYHCRKPYSLSSTWKSICFNFWITWKTWNSVEHIQCISTWFRICEKIFKMKQIYSHLHILEKTHPEMFQQHKSQCLVGSYTEKVCQWDACCQQLAIKICEKTVNGRHTPGLLQVLFFNRV